MARTGFDPISTNDATATKTVGGLYEHEGKGYRYYQNKKTGSTTLGEVMAFGTGQGEVIQGTADSSAAGVAAGVVSQDNFGFFQVSGEGNVQLAADNPGKGVKTGAAGQGTIATAADLPETFVGVQVLAVSGSLALCDLRMV